MFDFDAEQTRSEWGHWEKMERTLESTFHALGAKRENLERQCASAPSVERDDELRQTKHAQRETLGQWLCAARRRRSAQEMVMDDAARRGLMSRDDFNEFKIRFDKERQVFESKFGEGCLDEPMSMRFDKDRGPGHDHERD